MTQKLAVAYLSSVKSSPLKVMKVTKAVRGLTVSESLKLLQFSKLKIAAARMIQAGARDKKLI